MNQDGVSDLLVGAFVVSGLYIAFGDDGGAADTSAAVTAAIVSGILGCVFYTVYEARSWVRSIVGIAT